MKYLGALFSFIIITISLLALIWIYTPQQLTLGSVQINNSKYAIGIRQIDIFDEFYTISPFDDRLIHIDGSETKAGIIQEDSYINQDEHSPVDSLIERFQRDFNILVNKRIVPKFESNLQMSLYYDIKVKKNTVVITRIIENQSRKVVGIYNGLIYPPECNILIDGAPYETSHNSDSSNLKKISNVNYVELINPNTNSVFRLITNSTDEIIVDETYSIIFIKKYFNPDQLKADKIEDIQEIEVVPWI